MPSGTGPTSLPGIRGGGRSRRGLSASGTSLFSTRPGSTGHRELRNGPSFHPTKSFRMTMEAAKNQFSAASPETRVYSPSVQNLGSTVPLQLLPCFWGAQHGPPPPFPLGTQTHTHGCTRAKNRGLIWENQARCRLPPKFGRGPLYTAMLGDQTKVRDGRRWQKSCRTLGPQGRDEKLWALTSMPELSQHQSAGCPGPWPRTVPYPTFLSCRT